jgi:YggT family protein
MLFQVMTFLLEVVVTLVGGACLLRMYMRWRAMPTANPVGRFVQALSDWLVVPLRRLLPANGRVDAASLLGVWLLKVLQYAAMMLMLGLTHWALLPVLALLGVVKLAVSVATALIIISAVLSWTQSHSVLANLFDRLCAPLLAPLRRAVPLVGGIDLSPLVAVVILQVLAIVLGALQAQLFGVTVPLGAM